VATPYVSFTFQFVYVTWLTLLISGSSPHTFTCGLSNRVMSHSHFNSHTAYCIWNVKTWFSNFNHWSSSPSLFYHVPLKRDQGDWDSRLRLNDTPNAIGCIWHDSLYSYLDQVHTHSHAASQIELCLIHFSIHIIDMTHSTHIRIKSTHMHMWHLNPVFIHMQRIGLLGSYGCHSLRTKTFCVTADFDPLWPK